MPSVRKNLIKLTQVKICDHFLQTYTVVRAPIHEYLQLSQFILRNQM